jgi:hypothetical protein
MYEALLSEPIAPSAVDAQLRCMMQHGEAAQFNGELVVRGDLSGDMMRQSVECRH